jgi:hypothetical protein
VDYAVTPNLQIVILVTGEKECNQMG